MASRALSGRLVSVLLAGVLSVAIGPVFAGGKNAVSNMYDVNLSAGDCSTNTGCFFFSGTVSPQFDGTTYAGLTAGVFDFPNGYAFAVSCTGPQYADAINVNAGGLSSVSVTLDPTAPGCSSNIFFGTSSAITIKVTGHADGDSHSSITGIETDTFNNGTGTVTVRLNTQNDCYSEAFTGTVVSPIVVSNLHGGACIQHRIQL